MLGRNYNFIINYNNKKIDLEFKMSALKNLFDMVHYSPFEFIHEFLNSDEDRVVKIAQLLFCMTDGKLDIVDVLKNLLIDEDIIDGIYVQLVRIITLELKTEIDEEYESKDEIKELTSEEKTDNFISWWNYMYYTAKINLKLTYEEMLNNTVRELKSMDALNKGYLKNILLDAYIQVVKSQNKTEKEEVKRITVNNRPKSLRDIFK